jgi:hypothetical protein
VSAQKSLIVVTHEPPFPLTHGGRVDQFNRYSYLKSMGWQIVLVTWVRASVNKDLECLRRQLSEAFTDVVFLKNDLTIGNLLFRLFALPVHSQHISNLYVFARKRRWLARRLEAYRPSAIILDHLYAGLLARALAVDMKIPLLYRSNNIEHVYVPEMMRASTKLSVKLKFFLASLHLKDFEFDIQRKSAWTFDCSNDDLQYWRSLGFDRNSWAPPLINPVLRTAIVTLPRGERPYDAVFLGSLRSAANIEAVHWFLKDVMPILVTKKADIKILIAGSTPAEALRRMIDDCPGVTLLSDPESAVAVRSQGRVLINPVLGGSGINVKQVEMLFEDAPIVTTAFGVRGFDAETRECFLVADGPADFAEKIIYALNVKGVEGRETARARFSGGGASLFARELECVLDRRPGADSIYL